MAPAPTKQLFQLRPKLRPLPEPYLSKFFSSSSDTTNTAPPPPPPPPSDSRHEPSPRPFSFSSISNSPNPPPGTADFNTDMRKRLAEFRRSTSSPAQSGADRSFNPPSNRPQHISFKDLYNRSVLSKGDNRSNEATQSQSQSQSQSRFSDMLKMRPSGSNVKDSPFVIGGSDHMSASIFAKEMKDKRGRNNSDRTKFVRMYGYEDLGEQLTKLRPEKRVEKNWFSLGELNERLMKLREMEKETPSTLVFEELRGALVTLQMSNDENTKKTMIQRLDVLGQLGGTPTFMLHPPKEHLLEKYIHPDNLSSEEKMKLELQKVRDEFKMSESDCGSSRVQVAQLTTKIKYLSGVLHKKDKHSRKGLQAMVQKRKKLLKYLRRTDWDSYCLVLSKLGLRDNPDYKF